MIKLTEFEQVFDTKEELVIHWLNNNEIDFNSISRAYAAKLEQDYFYYDLLELKKKVHLKK